jgi:hypothetical protein
MSLIPFIRWHRCFELALFGLHSAELVEGEPIKSASAFFVTVSILFFLGVNAHGDALSCRLLFKPTVDEGPSAKQMNRVFRAFNKLADEVGDSNIEERATKLPIAVTKVEEAALKYFRLAKIDYTIQPAKQVSVPGENGATDVRVRDIVVRGRADGNSMSQFLNAFGKDKKSPVTFIFIPTLTVDHRSYTAAYDPAPEVVEFGATALTDWFFGFGHVLRHEVQHHLEEQKIREGKFSLARIILENDLDLNEHYYDAYLSLDELETHLRDLRYVLKIADRSETVSTIHSHDPEDMKIALSAMREMAATEKAATLEGMIEKAREGVAQANSNFNPKRPKIQIASFNLAVFTIKNPDGGTYKRTKIQVTVPEGATKAEAFSALHVLIDQSQKRIDEIDREFKVLKGLIPE